MEKVILEKVEIDVFVAQDKTIEHQYVIKAYLKVERM